MTGSIPCLRGGIMVSLSAPPGTNAALDQALFPSPTDIALSVPSNQMMMSFENEAPELPRRQFQEEEEEKEVSRVMNSEPRYGSMQEPSSIVPTADPFGLKDWVTLDRPSSEEPDDNLADFAFDFDQ